MAQQRKWTQGTDRNRYTVKLAELALRVQRLSVAQKIDNIAGLVGMHAPTLKDTPGGTDMLQQIQTALKQSRAALKGK